jgi:hypothetical protein
MIHKDFKEFSLIMIVIFYIFLTSSALDGWLQMINSSLIFINGPRQVIKDLFTPNSGQEVFPNAVQEMLSIQQEIDFTDYRLSKSLSSNVGVIQRSVEALWPVKFEPDSQYIFCTVEELLNYPSCRTLKSKSEVSLVLCTK